MRTKGRAICDSFASLPCPFSLMWFLILDLISSVSFSDGGSPSPILRRYSRSVRGQLLQHKYQNEKSLCKNAPKSSTNNWQRIPNRLSWALIRAAAAMMPPRTFHSSWCIKLSRWSLHSSECLSHQLEGPTNRTGSFDRPLRPRGR